MDVYATREETESMLILKKCDWEFSLNPDWELHVKHFSTLIWLVYIFWYKREVTHLFSLSPALNLRYFSAACPNLKKCIKMSILLIKNNQIYETLGHIFKTVCHLPQTSTFKNKTEFWLKYSMNKIYIKIGEQQLKQSVPKRFTIHLHAFP